MLAIAYFSCRLQLAIAGDSPNSVMPRHDERNENIICMSLKLFCNELEATLQRCGDIPESSSTGRGEATAPGKQGPYI